METCVTTRYQHTHYTSNAILIDERRSAALGIRTNDCDNDPELFDDSPDSSPRLGAGASVTVTCAESGRRNLVAQLQPGRHGTVDMTGLSFALWCSKVCDWE